MSLFLIPFGIFLALLAPVAWLEKRLRAAMVTRHPAALHATEGNVRPLPRHERLAERHSRYRMLQDPEIDRHMRNVHRAQRSVQYVWFAFAALIIVLVIVTAVNR